MPHFPRSPLIVAMALAALLGSCPEPLWAAEPATQPTTGAPDEVPYVTLLQTDARLFGFTVERFTATRNQDLVRQYFVNNVRKAGDRFAAHVEIVGTFLTDLVPGPAEGRIPLLLSWLGSVPPDKELGAPVLERVRLYLLVRGLAARRGALDPARADVKAALDGLRAFVAANDKDPWGPFLQALAAQALSLGSVEAGFDQPPLALLNKASLLATQDSHLHYVLGHLYRLVLDQADVPTFVKLVTAEFEKALLLQPSNRELFTRVTTIYAELHDQLDGRNAPEPFWFEELVYKRILALDPTNAQVHNNLAFLYATYGVNLKQALKEARVANQLKPQDPMLLDTLGWAHYRNGQLREALEALKKAAELKPDMADVHFHLASVYYDLDEFEPTVRHFREAIRLDPANAFARNNLAYFLAEKGQSLEEASALSEQANAMSADNAAFLDTRGWVLHKLGRSAEALGPIQRAVGLAPDTSELHIHLGQVLLALNRFDEAVAAFEHALAFDQDNKVVARRLSRLFALQGLQAALRNYSRIAGVRDDKENFKIFYDLMARIHQEDGDYLHAMAALRAYADLMPGQAPRTSGGGAPPPAAQDVPPTTAPVTVPPLPPVSRTEAEQWRSVAAYLPASSEVLLGVTAGGLLKLFDLFAERHQTPLPPALLRGLIASRLPLRVVLGFPARAPADARLAVVALQFTEPTLQLLRTRLEGMNGTEVDVPASTATVRFEGQTYKGFAMGQIAVPYGQVGYLVASKDVLLLAAGRAALVEAADALAAGRTPGGPAALAGEGFRALGAGLDATVDAVSFAAFPEPERFQGLALEPAYRAMLDAVATVGAVYRLLPGDALEERSVVTPRAGVTPEVAHQRLAPVLEDLKSKLSLLSAGAVVVEGAYALREGRLEGATLFKGFPKWLSGVLGALPLRDLPGTTPGTAPSLPPESGDEGDDEGEGRPPTDPDEPGEGDSLDELLPTTGPARPR